MIAPGILPNGWSAIAKIEVDPEIATGTARAIPNQSLTCDET